MANLAYATPCGSATVIPAPTEAQRRALALREMDADVHAALVRDLIVFRQNDYDQRAAEALYAAAIGKQNAEKAFAMAVSSSVRGDDLAVVGAHFRQWALLAQGHLVSDLVDLTIERQRVTFGRRK